MKLDAEKIISCLDQLKKSTWLGESRKWWPDYIYHFTDIKNAINILNTDQILSRHLAELNNQMVNDNASPEVICQTNQQWKNYVRFYFRPRTPTQYNNEGFRPCDKIELGGAHCPVPVYFLFASRPILCMKESLFSHGSLASPVTMPLHNADDFYEIPFHLVYHDTSFTPDERDSIIHHRQAEIIVPNRIDLRHLKYIWCRSQAEYETLLYLLTPQAIKKWHRKIGVSAKPYLFFKRWTFVEKVELSSHGIKLFFNQDTIITPPGPFHARVLITENNSGTQWVWDNKEYYAKDKLIINLDNMPASNYYSVTFYLDNHLAYSQEFNDFDVPF